ncbi:hypothetical protein MRX96_028634 [Rhipicephalus microplus]
MCTTDDCVRLAELIANITSATGVDPCEDFGAYVCSAVSSYIGEADPKGNSVVPSAMDTAIPTWLDGLGGTLRDGSVTLRTGRKPLEMYDSCMGVDGSRGYGTDPTEFLRLLKEVGLSWPEDPPKGVDAICVFVSLAFLYEAPAWFSVAIAESSSASQEWRLVISPDRYTSSLWVRHENTMRSEEYVSFWKAMQRSLVGDSGTSVDEKAIEETAKMNDDILSKLYAALTKPLKRTALLSIADMANYTTSITPASWFRALAGCLPLRPTLATEVFLTNVAYVRTIGDLFAAYDDQKLVRHLSWTFVQVYGPVVNPQLFSDQLEDANITLVYRPLFCGLNVEIPYKLLLSTLYYVARVSDYDRASINAAFVNLVATAVEKVSNCSWLDADGKYLTDAKVKAVNASIWPNEALLKTRLLESMYEGFPENKTSFSLYWVDSRRAIRRSKSRYQLYRRLSTGPINSQEPYLITPLKALCTGGIGFLMALHIIKSIDREGLRWDPNGNFVDSFLSQASLEEFVMLDLCPGRGRQMTAFPEIPAVEVAYAALKAALRKDSRRYRIAKNLSEEQVFFIILCYMTCVRGHVGIHHVGDNCNKALKNFPEFARTFSCTQGSKMNPRSKCLFF